jgi:hypothetical protein
VSSLEHYRFVCPKRKQFFESHRDRHFALVVIQVSLRRQLVEESDVPSPGTVIGIIMVLPYSLPDHWVASSSVSVFLFVCLKPIDFSLHPLDVRPRFGTLHPVL